MKIGSVSFLYGSGTIALIRFSDISESSFEDKFRHLLTKIICKY